MVSKIFSFHPYLGKISILTHIFQMGWFNHHLVYIYIYTIRLVVSDGKFNVLLTVAHKVIPEDTSSFEVDGLSIHALPVLHGADYVPWQKKWRVYGI